MITLATGILGEVGQLTITRPGCPRVRRQRAEVPGALPYGHANRLLIPELTAGRPFAQGAPA